MNPNEIAFFVMYRTQAVSPGGLTRDELPYTTEFDALRHHYNTQCREHLSEHQFWGLLKYVLKVGEEHIENYLRRNGVAFPAKP